MFASWKVEICCGSLLDVMTASRFPIDRIELNSALELGGLTPTIAELRHARGFTDFPIMCMDRLRSAGFCYDSTELEVMEDDAEILLENGADGIVFGALNPDHTVNEAFVRKMTMMIHDAGRTAVFHRAFDETRDPDEACRTLISCGVDRILTSGQEETVQKGAQLVHHLIETYGKEIEILPGCGIQASNILEVLQKTGSDQFHMTAKSMRMDTALYAAVDAKNLNAVYQKLNSRTEQKHISLTGEDQAMLENDRYEEEEEPYDDEERR
ncbi:MAG: copper homeostasis protein CutC [Bulleidia sp.]